MAQNPFDQLSKQYLEDFLAPIGQVIRNLEIPGEAKFVDVFFTPTPATPTDPDLGLLGQIVQTTCSIEPFRNPPSRTEIRTCLLKLLWLQEAHRRTAKQAKQKLHEPQLPQLWILATHISQPVLNDFGAQLDPHWPSGVYRLPTGYKTTFVAINQLPATEDTLWLRILGKGPTQQQAIDEVLNLPPNHPRRNNILRLLAGWHIRMNLGELPELSEQKTAMALSQAFLDWEQQTQERSHQEGQLVSLRSVLHLMLPQKLGPLPDRCRSAITLLQVPQLEALALALLNFETIADLEAWLTQRLRSDLPTTWADRLPGNSAAIATASLDQLLTWILGSNPIG
jgi:Domain of unknown function (DUF4351)